MYQVAIVHSAKVKNRNGPVQLSEGLRDWAFDWRAISVWNFRALSTLYDLLHTDDRPMDLDAGSRRWPIDDLVRRLPHLHPNLFGGPHRIEHTAHDLRRARAARLVRRLLFHQLGVRQDDAKLIVQPVEKRS